MIDLKHIPTRAELKYFGLIFAVFFGIIGAVIGLKFDAWTAAKVLWIIGGAVCVIYYALPFTQVGIFRAWITITYPLSWLGSHLILGGTYYLVLTPIGLIMRLFGHDPMRKRMERDAKTYWIERKPVTDTQRYFKQF